jgi:hypothetical protein
MVIQAQVLRAIHKQDKSPSTRDCDLAECLGDADNVAFRTDGVNT